jgi:hypothetical protein
VAVLDQISWIVVGYAVLVALVSAYAAYRWRARPPWLASLAWMLEFLAGLRAVAGLGWLLAGHEPDSYSTHVGYLVVSVGVIPFALQSVRDDEDVWSLGVIAVAALTVAAISVRVVMTL